MADRHGRARATRASPAPSQQTTGAVGYVEQAYALQHKFTTASVKNKAGNYVEPSLESTSAAAEGVEVPANLGFKIKNPSSPKAYPITSQTFIIVYKDMCKAGIPGGEAAAKGVVAFLNYGFGAGQATLAAGRLRGAAERNPGKVEGCGQRTAVQRNRHRLIGLPADPLI